MAGFSNKVVLITGAGGGIGRHYALEFARRGARVLVNDLGSDVRGEAGGEDSAARVVAEITAAGGVAIANRASVTDRAGAASIVQDALDNWGQIDIVVTNAGILRNRTMKNNNLDDIKTVLDVHVMGALNVVYAAWPHLYNQGHGRVVLTSSISGIAGAFGQSAYATAKMAMLGLMNSLALEGRPKGVHVNCIAPGAATRMTALEASLGIDVDNPQADFHPKLIAPAVMYLASDEAPNGVVLHAQGGRFFRTTVVRNLGVNLGTEATLEDVESNLEALLDMSEPRDMPPI
jgi:NAD(P)-dependent dehydrogenase (short-subunit alcohol dehydrogenase family)